MQCFPYAGGAGGGFGGATGAVDTAIAAAAATEHQLRERWGNFHGQQQPEAS